MKWDWIFFDADETLFTFDSFTGLQRMFLDYSVTFTAEDFQDYQPLTSHCGWIIKTARSLHYSFSTGGLRAGPND